MKKICKKCKKEFETNFKLPNNKTHQSRNRRYCYECTPLHNRRRAINYDSNNNTKKCLECNQFFPYNEKYFYSRKGREDLYSVCKKCERIKSKKIHTEIKQKCVEYLGGQCVICGYNKYFGALKFHHVNPELKELKISSLYNSGWEKLKKELDKCILLCGNCHDETHGGLHAEYLKYSHLKNIE